MVGDKRSEISSVIYFLPYSLTQQTVLDRYTQGWPVWSAVSFFRLKRHVD